MTDEKKQQVADILTAQCHTEACPWWDALDLDSPCPLKGTACSAVTAQSWLDWMEQEEKADA